MKYVIEYAEEFDWKSLERITKRDLIIIRKTIEEKLTVAPEIFGKPLQETLKGHRRLRVGMYRVIFVIKNNKVIITRIAQRSKVYRSR